MKSELREKLKVLKGIIQQMNSKTVSLINISAEIEIKIKNSTDDEARLLEGQLDKLITQYQKNIINLKENKNENIHQF